MLISNTAVRVLAPVLPKGRNILGNILEGLHLSGNTLEVTDSHILLQIDVSSGLTAEDIPNRNGSGPVDHTPDMQDCILRPDQLLAAAKLAKKQRIPVAQHINLTQPENAPVEGWTANGAVWGDNGWQDFAVQTIDGVYPNTGAIVSDAKQNTTEAKIMFSLPVLEKLVKAMKQLRSPSDAMKTRVLMTIHGPDEAVELVFSTADVRVTGVMMPCRQPE